MLVSIVPLPILPRKLVCCMWSGVDVVCGLCVVGVVSVATTNICAGMSDSAYIDCMTSKYVTSRRLELLVNVDSRIQCLKGRCQAVRGVAGWANSVNMSCRHNMRLFDETCEKCRILQVVELLIV